MFAGRQEDLEDMRREEEEKKRKKKRRWRHHPPTRQQPASPQRPAAAACSFYENCYSGVLAKSSRSKTIGCTLPPPPSNKSRACSEKNQLALSDRTHVINFLSSKEDATKIGHRQNPVRRNSFASNRVSVRAALACLVRKKSAGAAVPRRNTADIMRERVRRLLLRRNFRAGTKPRLDFSSRFSNAKSIDLSDFVLNLRFKAV